MNWIIPLPELFLYGGAFALAMIIHLLAESQQRRDRVRENARIRKQAIDGVIAHAEAAKKRTP